VRVSFIFRYGQNETFYAIQFPFLVCISTTGTCKQRYKRTGNFYESLYGAEIRWKIIGGFPCKKPKKRNKFGGPCLLCVFCILALFRASGGRFG